MIFSKKIGIIATGSNPTLFALDNNSMKLYTYDGQIKESLILLGAFVRCFGTTKKYNYNHYIKLESNIDCASTNENISVIVEE